MIITNNNFQEWAETWFDIFPNMISLTIDSHIGIWMIDVKDHPQYNYVRELWEANYIKLLHKCKYVEIPISILKKAGIVFDKNFNYSKAIIEKI